MREYRVEILSEGKWVKYTAGCIEDAYELAAEEFGDDDIGRVALVV